MRKFGPNVKHVIDCKDLNTERNLRYKSMALAKQYQSICPRLYPLAPDNLIDFKEQNFHHVEEELKEFDIIFSEAGLRIELYPAKCAGVFSEDVITNKFLINEEEQKVIETISVMNQDARSTSEHLNNIDLANIIPEKTFTNEPEILFCGTISMKPTGTRCSSCIYLNIPGNKATKSEEEKYQTTPRNLFDNNYGIMLD